MLARPGRSWSKLPCRSFCASESEGWCGRLSGRRQLGSERVPRKTPGALGGSGRGVEGWEPKLDQLCAGAGRRNAMDGPEGDGTVEPQVRQQRCGMTMGARSEPADQRVGWQDVKWTRTRDGYGYEQVGRSHTQTPCRIAASRSAQQRCSLTKAEWC